MVCTWKPGSLFILIILWETRKERERKRNERERGRGRNERGSKRKRGMSHRKKGPGSGGFCIWISRREVGRRKEREWERKERRGERTDSFSSCDSCKNRKQVPWEPLTRTDWFFSASFSWTESEQTHRFNWRHNDSTFSLSSSLSLSLWLLLPAFYTFSLFLGPRCLLLHSLHPRTGNGQVATTRTIVVVSIEYMVVNQNYERERMTRGRRKEKERQEKVGERKKDKRKKKKRKRRTHHVKTVQREGKFIPFVSFSSFNLSLSCLFQFERNRRRETKQRGRETQQRGRETQQRERERVETQSFGQ